MNNNYEDNDGELAALIQQPEPDMVIPDDDNNGRVNPVLRPVPVQPRVILAPGGIQRGNNNMPSNGGQKKKRTSKNSRKYKTSKNSRKYKNKNHKNKNRKHQTRKIKRVIKKIK